MLVAANLYQRFFPMMMTAAGTAKAARVVILGAGVAGLQAIATARRLGAVVEASDVRPAVKEQIESLGAKFIDVPYETDEEREAAAGVGGYARPMPPSWLECQAKAVAERIRQADVVITTALILGLRRFLVGGIRLQHHPRIAKRIGPRHRPIGIVPERHQHATRGPLRRTARGWQAPLQRKTGYRQRPLKQKPRYNDRNQLRGMEVGRSGVHRSGRSQPQPCQHRPGGHTASAILDPGSLQAVPSDHHHLRFRACM